MTFILILSTTIAVVVSFLCSLAEALLLSFSPLALQRMRTTRPRAAESWRRLKSNIARPITAILVLNTVAHTGGATVAGGAFSQLYGEENIWIFSVLFTVIILFGTEILPKVIGVSFHKQLSPLAGPILEVITRLLHPLIRLSEVMFRRLSPKAESDQITTADLITLASLARSGKSINLEQENIIVNAVRLSHTLLTHAMIPRDRIRFITIGEQPETLLALIRRGGHTRYPVSRSRNPDDIFAYITTKKALPATHDDLSRLLQQAKPLHTVDANATLMTALHAMLHNKEHLLSVVNDQCQCVGIVTLEDIAGELLSADIELFK